MASRANASLSSAAGRSLTPIAGRVTAPPSSKPGKRNISDVLNDATVDQSERTTERTRQQHEVKLANIDLKKRKLTLRAEKNAVVRHAEEASRTRDHEYRMEELRLRHSLQARPTHFPLSDSHTSTLLSVALDNPSALLNLVVTAQAPHSYTGLLLDGFGDSAGLRGVGGGKQFGDRI